MAFDWSKDLDYYAWGDPELRRIPEYGHPVLSDQNYMGALIVLLLSRLGERQTFTQQDIDEARSYGFEVVQKLPSIDDKLEVRIK